MPLDREHTLSWIGLSSLAGVGRATFRSLVRSFGSADRVLSAPPDELRERGGLSEKIIGEMDSYPWRERAEEELAKAAKEKGLLSDIRDFDEKSPAFFERFFTEKPKIHLDRLQSLIYELAKSGDAVFFGRGSPMLLSNRSDVPSMCLSQVPWRSASRG